MKRFTGTVEELGNVDVSRMAKWVQSIPLEEWPQQSNTELKPAMVSNLDWHSFGEIMWPIVYAIGHGIEGPEDHAGSGLYQGNTYQHMLSVVMPGHSIPPHKDQQADYWMTRIHIPLLGNSKSWTIMDDGKHALKVGKAYKVNVLATHAVENKGKTPRIHFMFDVRQG